MITRFPDVVVETLEVQEFTYLSVSRCRDTDQKLRKPWVDEYWQRADPYYSDGDQAESFSEFCARAEHFVHSMGERDFELAFVFTHEKWIKGLIWRAMQLSNVLNSASMTAFNKFALSFKVPNASLLPVKMDNDEQLYFGNINTIVSL